MLTSINQGEALYWCFAAGIMLTYTALCFENKIAKWALYCLAVAFVAPPLFYLWLAAVFP